MFGPKIEIQCITYACVTGMCLGRFDMFGQKYEKMNVLKCGVPMPDAIAMSIGKHILKHEHFKQPP